MEKEGTLKIYENLKKRRVLQHTCRFKSTVQLCITGLGFKHSIRSRCIGNNVLFPAYRSFPETFANDHTRMYVPWSGRDAIEKLKKLLITPSPSMGQDIRLD